MLVMRAEGAPTFETGGHKKKLEFLSIIHREYDLANFGLHNKDGKGK